MKKYLFLFAIVYLLTGNFASADVINPDYLSAKCPVNTIEVICDYSSNEPFGPVVWTNCDKYNENPFCAHLVKTGSSFGGHHKYCCGAGFDNPTTFSLFKFFTENSLQALFLTLLLELPIFYIFGFRNKRSILFVILANIISVIAFSAASFSLRGASFVIISEIIIVLFETIFLIKVIKGLNAKKIFLAVLIANIFSAIAGLFLWPFLFRFLMLQ